MHLGYEVPHVELLLEGHLNGYDNLGRVMAIMPAKFFNTTGICLPSKHYMLPPLTRLPDINEMISNEFYFAIHAPRQSGKTTCLMSLVEKINSDGQYYALYCSLAALRNVDDSETAMSGIVDQIRGWLRSSKVDRLRALANKSNENGYIAGYGTKVRLFLSDICQALDRELVVFFDEADCIHEKPLIPFLAQIRDGFIARFSSFSEFPRSLALVGMRDIRDYLYQVRPESESRGTSSPFNVKYKSLTLNDFTREEIKSLYDQHTFETGQIFEPKTIDRVWFWSEGQPWLVNALPFAVIFEQFKNNYSKVITGDDIDLAAQHLILTNPTHFDSLMARLTEPKVRRVIDSVIIGANTLPDNVSPDDRQYVIDLGLLKFDESNEDFLRPSNAIYRELIIRFLTKSIRQKMSSEFQNKWMDGTKLDMDGILKAFQTYWRENSGAGATSKVSEIKLFLKNFVGKILKKRNVGNTDEINKEIMEDVNINSPDFSSEAYAHIVLFAFLQRVLNGGADFIQREFAMGLTKTDICISDKDTRYPIELKIKDVQPLEKSILQLRGYMDICGAKEGWLVIFDKNPKTPWKKKIFWETIERADDTIHIVGC
ncbi:MAG: AAA-like domain-containing protein [Deltaproteobacteria bacterium]|nr:AAA-like domain-containing protein [Deltaproteobacteria bacterium]